ncbi:MAG: hypothetical protein AB7S78_08695 [Candidatus Omnitrophota bacterium]
MIGETGCCGYSMEDKGPNLFGLLTLSVPMLVASAVVLPFFYLFSFVVPTARRTKNFLMVVIRANLNLIHKKPFIPLYRCKIAGRFFSVSPKFSGMIYRNFNLTIFLMIWISVIFPVILWFK